MPVAPRLPTVSPATQTTTLASSAGATADAFGAPQGRAAQRFGQQAGQAGDTLSALALEQARDDNIRNAKQRDLEVAELIARVTRGDGTPDNPGYYSLNGEDAVRAHGQAAKDIDDGIAKIRGGITNQEAMDMFDAATGVRRQREFDSMAAHQQKGRADAEEMLSKARQADALDYAMAHGPDTTGQGDIAIAQSVGVAVGEAVKQAKRAGADGETQAIVAEQAEAVIIRGAVIAALKGSDVARAQDILDKAKASGRLLGSTEAELDGMLKAVTDTETAQTAVGEIWENTDLATMEMKLAFARDNFSGDVEIAIIAGLKQRQEENNNAIQQQVFDTTNYFLGGIADGKTIVELGMANPEALAFLQTHPAQLEIVRNAQQNMNDGSIFRLDSDNRSFIALSRLPAAEFRKANLDAVRSELTKGEYMKLVELQNASISAFNEGQSDIGPVNDVINLAKRFLDPDLKIGTINQTDDGNKIVAELTLWTIDFLEANERSPGLKEIATQVALLTSESVVPAQTNLGRIVSGPFGGKSRDAIDLFGPDTTPEQRRKASIHESDFTPGMIRAANREVQNYLKNIAKVNEDRAAEGKDPLPAKQMTKENMEDLHGAMLVRDTFASKLNLGTATAGDLKEYEDAVDRVDALLGYSVRER